MKPRMGVVVDFKKDIREDLGYTSPERAPEKRSTAPWWKGASKSYKPTAPLESPLKIWWLKEQEKKL